MQCPQLCNWPRSCSGMNASKGQKRRSCFWMAFISMMTSATKMNAVTVSEINETSRIIKPTVTTIISMMLPIVCHSLNDGGFNIVLINRLIIVITLDEKLYLLYLAGSSAASNYSFSYKPIRLLSGMPNCACSFLIIGSVRLRLRFNTS